MKESLVQLLCSPTDGSALALKVFVRAGSEIVSGELVDASGRRFPIVEGVPLFAEEAAVDETFAFKWRLIGDSYGYEEPARSIRQNWYLERFGFGTRDKLLEGLRCKEMILDAGTGSGVDAAMFAESRTTVIAIDLSQEAASATYRHLGYLPNVHVLQADLQHLPFPPSIFDYISCDQVLHHTPDPAQSFTALTRHLRCGGNIAVYVYKRKGPIREFTDDYLRKHVTQMMAEECYEFCQAVTLLGKALSDLKAMVDVPADIPLLGIKSGPQDVQRFFYWNVMKCFWNDGYDFETNAVINFDWYHPKYAWRFTPEQVRSWFERHHYEIGTFNVLPSGIAALGVLKQPQLRGRREG